MVRRFLSGLVLTALALAGVVALPSSANAQAGPGPWVAQTEAQTRTWSSIAYGAGLFVAVSDDGAGGVMTSPDGVAWTARPTFDGDDRSWTAITYGGGQFVAVSELGGSAEPVMTSADGLTWTPKSAPDAGWSSVAFGNGTYIAVGHRRDTMWSTDGGTWEYTTGAEENEWTSVAYGDGIFVAIGSLYGSGEKQVMTTSNGVTWAVSPTGASDENEWSSVTYGGGQFVAVACDCIGPQVMTSPDGILWTSRAAANENEWYSVTYGDGHYVAVSRYDSAGPQVMTSTDGITWTAQAASNENVWNSVAYGNGVFAAVAMSTDAGQVMTSYTPTVTSVSPASGPLVGGTSVTVTGTGLSGATAATFGGVAATNVVSVSATQLTATIPAHAAGEVDVVVTSPGGTGTGSNAFRYVPAPTIATVSPASGSNAGGTEVVITGSNLITASSVTFGGVAASFRVDTGGTAATVIATTPAHVAGAFDVAVTSPSGTATRPAAFTFVAPAPAPPPAPTPTPPAPPAPAPAPQPVGPSPTLRQASLNVRFVAQTARMTAAQRLRIREFVAEQDGPIVGTRIIGFPTKSTRAARALSRDRAEAVAEVLTIQDVTVDERPSRLNGVGDTTEFPARTGRVYLTLWSVS